MLDKFVDLVEHISNAVRESEFPNPSNGPFAPRNTLRNITDSSVTDTIWPDSTGDLSASNKELVEFIRGQALEIFAIAIYLDENLEKMLRLFMKHDKSDRSLPMSDADLEKIWPRPRDAIRRRSFKKHQHLFRAQGFPMQGRFSVIHLGPNVVLPILESKHMSHGQFGIVHKVSLHEEFLDLNDPIRKAQGVAAIKELRESIEDEMAKHAWEREVKALQEICQLGIPHVVEIAAMIAIEKKQYFVFPWADGGNLRNLWKSRDSYHERSEIACRYIPDIVNQLVGLTDALERLHAFPYGEAASYRHGDLKPENILIFDSKSPSFLGIWKMADLGLARYHMAATGDRLYVTSNSGAGTISYQPPESVDAKAAPTSRLYDIWSMGCIFLQLMTWLVYGTSEIEELTRKTKSVFAKGESSYWSAESWDETNGYHNLKVHPSVTKHMERMKGDVQGSKALQGLLLIIQDKLLVVQRPKEATISESGCRTNAADLHRSLKKIQAACEDRGYWFSGGNVVQQASHLQIPQGQTLDVGRGNKLNDNWVRAVDKTFVSTLLNRPELRDSIRLDRVPKANLCIKCENLDFFAEKFQITDTFQELRREASLCDFCKLRWNLGKDSFSHEVQSIVFDLVGSDLQLNHQPVISFLACHEDSDSGLGWSDTTDIWPQIGLSRLPPVGSEAHFTILRDWLQDCDEHHDSCRPLKNSSAQLPKRLIDVGQGGGTGVSLYETKQDDALEYIALSHPWGPHSSSHFCTYPENIDHHLQGILLKDLPQTFQDAVGATRSLNQRYLWIDSLCIIQGPNGDFNEQAKHMEGIFRQAYCVLAASCAKGQQDGFLKLRDERRCLKIHQDLSSRPPIYVCDFIDDFQQHALGSHLNKRGWVLQERALARRTIFFTEKQTYWECGAGVRCETTMKMNNKLASFLGDSRFPEVGMRSTHGGKIRLFQDLYSKYSRLELSHDTDRPVAIAGIEKQLISSFDVRGGFGILDDGGRGLLWRSLLWKRAQDASSGLRRIEFGLLKGAAVAIIPPPSWSWMAYKGAIDYLGLPFDEVDWEKDDIYSRWSRGAGKSWSYSGDYLTCPLEMTVHGRSFDLQEARTSCSASIVLDDPDRMDKLEPFLECVVLGRLKGQTKESTDARTHYVLLVTPKAPQDGGSSPSYNRVGVGYMPGSFIDFSKQGIPGELR
ncbi:hypothetical protein N8I77_012351 [Diaporthe amygdali]|uniref:Protein kinase domain-containing protein n=1 Tax=Phomopsis amygdali TaxID=1214568 RepID=A0AAD9S5G0_PHOAM|nr:hypothetical protein N8I77_012351 [Diaporthe amygdali]